MLLFFGLSLLSLFFMMVIHASESLDDIRLHWNEYRCNPIYIPIAGIIRPDIGVQENFGHCVNMMGQSIFKYSLDSINLLFKDLNSGIQELAEPLPLMREMMSRIRKMLFSFGAQTFGKITASMSSVIYILVKVQDILRRFVGEGYIASFLAMAGIDFAVGFVQLCINTIKMFVYALLAISFILALFQPELLAFAVVIASMISASGF